MNPSYTTTNRGIHNQLHDYGTAWLPHSLNARAPTSRRFIVV